VLNYLFSQNVETDETFRKLFLLLQNRDLIK